MEHTFKYRKFNEAVLDHFLSQSEGSDTFIMSLDRVQLKGIAEKLNFEFDDLVRQLSPYFQTSWDEFKLIDGGQPLCFGIIGFQIWIGSEMGSKNEFTHKEYNPFLSKQLNLSIEQLQKLYRLYQEEIWQVAHKYILSKGYKSSIPKIGKGPGRYVQYPKSQTYFNIDDLRKISAIFFQKKLKPGLNLNYYDFIQATRIVDINSIDRKFQTPHARRVLNSVETEFGILQKQIFNFYLNWNGEQLNTTDEIPKTPLYYDELNGYFLIRESKEFYLNVNEDFKKNLQNNKVITSKTKHIILKRDPAYGDFEETLYAKVGDRIIFLIFDANNTLVPCLKSLGLKEKKFKEFSTFEITLNENHKSTCLSRVFSKINQSLSWLSGLKLNRSTYLHNFGPRYEIKKNCNVFINGEQKKYSEGELLDLSNYKCGNYTIQPVDGRKINFKIEESKMEEHRNPDFKHGWNLTSLEIEKKWDVAGILLKTSNHSVFTNRDFINLHLNRKKPLNLENQILKTLSNQI